MYFSPKTSADGLVFHYDTGNTVRSYLGEPTTNLAYAVNSYLNSNSNWWINAGNATFNDNDTSIQKPTIPNVDTSNLRIFSSTVTGTGGNQQLGSSIITVSSSTTYSFSIYYYFTGTTMQAQPYVRTAVNNDLLAYFGYNGDTNYLNWPRNKWILLKATVTTQANENGIYMSSYTGDTLGEKLAYFGYQVEQKSHCTPLVLGTRSATQGLKDLTAANTINLSNVSFDANAQMTFDGSNDYISLADGTKWFTNEWTYEMVLKFNGNTGTYQGLLWGEGDTGGGSGLQKLFTFYNYSYFHYRINNAVTGWADTDFTPTGFTPTKYNHLVWQFNNGVTNLYINGALAHTNNVRGAYSGGTNSPLYIGCRNDVAYVFNGEMPMLKRYSRALTADEVARNYNAIKSRFNIA